MSLQTALSTKLQNILDGAGGRPSPMAGIAGDVLLGTRLADLSALGLTTSGNGADLIGFYDSGSRITTDNVGAALREILAAGFTWIDDIRKAATELTIASGAITCTQGYHTVDTESDAATDNLDTINGIADGEMVLIRPANAARTVVLRDSAVGSGNIYCPCANTISLAEATDWAILVGDGTNVVVVAFSTTAAAGGGLGLLLSGTGASQGASLIGVRDVGNLLAAADAEAAFAELAARIQSSVGTIAGGDGAGKVGDLNTTPVELVAAPAAGYYIDVLEIHWFLDWASAAYDGTKTGNLMAKYTDGSGDEVVGQVAETGFMDQTGDTHAQTMGIDCVPVGGAAIVAHADNDWYSAAGDSPVKYEVIYRVLKVDPTA